jgi:hypothetical protein
MLTANFEVQPTELFAQRSHGYMGLTSKPDLDFVKPK